MNTQNLSHCNSPNPAPSFSDLIRSILIDHDLSSSEFARSIGVHKGTVTKMLTRSYSSEKPYVPGTDIVLAISVVYGLPLEEIMESIRPGYRLCVQLSAKKNNLDDVNILLDKYGHQALNIH